MTSSAYQKFTDVYQKIPQEGKWTLTSGKIKNVHMSSKYLLIAVM